MSCMEKIVIIGSPGAGKTTLAQKLSEILGVEVFHLDRFFWDPGWIEKPVEARIEIQKQLVQGERWIIEGTYVSSSDDRLNAADTIIFLDIPFLLCLWRVLNRYLKYRNKSRPDLPQGCPEKLHWPYILKVLVFPLRGHRLFFEKYEEIHARQRHKEKKTTLLCFKSSQEVAIFLQKLSLQQQEDGAYEGDRQAQQSVSEQVKTLVLAGAS